MIFIGFSRPKKFKLFSFLIRLWQGWSPYSHCFIKMHEPFFNQWIVIQAARGDVHLMRYEDFLKDNIAYHEEGHKCQEARKKQVFNWGLSNLQKPYSVKNILGIVLYRFFGIDALKDGNKAFICSELVARAIPCLKFNKPIDFVEPKDIYEALNDI